MDQLRQDRKEMIKKLSSHLHEPLNNGNSSRERVETYLKKLEHHQNPYKSYPDSPREEPNDDLVSITY